MLAWPHGPYLSERYFITLALALLQMIELYKLHPPPTKVLKQNFVVQAKCKKDGFLIDMRYEIILCSHHSSQVISIISTVSVWSNLNCQYLMSNAICQHKKRTGESESGSQVLSSQFYILTHYTTILAGPGRTVSFYNS